MFGGDVLAAEARHAAFYAISGKDVTARTRVEPPIHFTVDQVRIFWAEVARLLPEVKCSWV